MTNTTGSLLSHHLNQPAIVVQDKLAFGIRQRGLTQAMLQALGMQKSFCISTTIRAIFRSLT
jgi:hypothetical protein